MNSGLINSEKISSLIGSLSHVAQRSMTRFTNILGGAFLAIFILMTLVYSATQPVFNWDMIPYLASAKMDANSDIDTIHRDVYSQFQLKTDAATYEALTQGDAYRLRQFSDADAFGSMLPMYEVKFLYVELVRVLEPLVGGIEAMHLMSQLSVALLGGVIFYWLYAAGALALSPVICGLLFVTGFPELARSGVPDLVQAAIFALGLVVLWQGRGLLSSVTAVFLLLIAFALRPDLLLVLFAFVLASIIWGGRLWQVLTAFAIAAIIYPHVTQAAGHPGWWTHFMFSLVTYSHTLVGFDPDFSFFYYGRSLVRGLTYSFVAQSWFILLVLGIMFRTYAWSHKISFDQISNLIFWACALGIMGKFVIFPIPDTRVYIAPLIGMYLAMAPALAQLFGLYKDRNGHKKGPGY